MSMGLNQLLLKLYYKDINGYKARDPLLLGAHVLFTNGGCFRYTVKKSKVILNLC